MRDNRTFSLHFVNILKTDTSVAKTKLGVLDQKE